MSTISCFKFKKCLLHAFILNLSWVFRTQKKKNENFCQKTKVACAEITLCCRLCIHERVLNNKIGKNVHVERVKISLKCFLFISSHEAFCVFYFKTHTQIKKYLWCFKNVDFEYYIATISKFFPCYNDCSIKFRFFAVTG